MSEVKLYLGDCYEELHKVEDESIDLIVLDPPYLTTKEAWDQQEVVQPELSQLLLLKAKPSCSLYVWCGIGEKSQSLIRWFPIFGDDWHFKDLITWKKRRGIGMRKGWLYTREEIMWFVKNNKRFIWNKKEQYNQSEKNQFKVGFSGYECLSEFKRITNVWTDIPEILRNKGIKHYTPKPLQAMERIIQAHTQEGDIVLDCFMGSGTTGVACMRLNRHFVGIEIVKEYFELARERITSQERYREAK